VVVKWQAGPWGRAPEKGPPVGACGGVSRGSAGRTHGGRTTGGDVALTFFLMVEILQSPDGNPFSKY
jgi:hypothetical protein